MSVTEIKSDMETTPDEMQRLIVAMREALTDSMVERLASTAGVALEVVDRLNEPDTRDAVHSMIDRFTEFHRIGALDTLCETVLLIHAIRSAATDNIVDRLAEFFEQMVNTLGSDDMAEAAQDILGSLEVAAQSTKQTPSGGLFSTLSLLGKPESRQSLSFLLKFGEELQKSRSR